MSVISCIPPFVCSLPPSCVPLLPFPVKIWQQKPKCKVRLLILLESLVEVGLHPALLPGTGLQEGPHWLRHQQMLLKWGLICSLFVFLFMSPEVAFACVLKAGSDHEEQLTQ